MRYSNRSEKNTAVVRRLAYAGSALASVLALTACLGGGGGDTAANQCLPGQACGSGGDDGLLPSQIVTCKNYNNEAIQVRPKTIAVHNNSAGMIYPVLATSKNAVNEWIQGCLRTKDANPTNYVYKLYVNEGKGIPPGTSVTITLPLYSALKRGDLSNANAPYEYITWWNGGRVVLADRNDRLLDVYDAATKTGEDVAFTTPESVTCTGQGTTCALSTYYSNIQFPENINAQLSEYTFGDSIIAPDDPSGPRLLKPENVGYNISYVDHVYLPVAIGPKGNPYIGFSGSDMPLDTFRQTLSNFLDTTGDGWPVYNLAGDLKLPGGYNIFAQRAGRLIMDEDIPVQPAGVANPPVLTVRKCLEDKCSDDEQRNLRFGTAVQRMQNLWGTCVTGWSFGEDENGKPIKKEAYVSADAVGNCNTAVAAVEGKPGLTLGQSLSAVRDFFKQNHDNYLALYESGACAEGDPQVPAFDFWQAMTHIYGWVPFNEGCGAGANPLAETTIPGWDHASIQSMYIHSLQYNHQNSQVQADPTLLFNPYVQLIHDTAKGQGLGMSAYGFSVDDAVGFMSELGNGLIFTVGGTKGLENPKQFSYRDGFELMVGAADAKISPNQAMIKFYGVCVIDENPDDPDCMNMVQDVALPEDRRIPAFRVGTVSKYPIRVNFTDLDDNFYSILVKESFQACTPVNGKDNCAPPNASGLFDKLKINLETADGSCIVRKGYRGEVHPKSDAWCKGAAPNSTRVEQLIKNYLSFPPLVEYM